MVFSTIEKAVEDLREGKIIIVVDDENRENEGDLVVAAEFITPEKMAFFIRYTGGVVCLSMCEKIADKLNLHTMVEDNTSKNNTAFTVSIEAKHGISTGISAHDRTKTILTAISDEHSHEDLCRPGHVFPLRARSGGVLEREGHTEASVDLCDIGQLKRAAVISELMHDDGTMMRLPEIKKFADEHNLIIVSIKDLVEYRM